MGKEITISTIGKECWRFSNGRVEVYTEEEIRKKFGFPPTKEWGSQMYGLGIEKIPDEYKNKEVRCIRKDGCWYVEMI